MAKPSVSVKDLGKCYKIYPDARHRMKEWLSPTRKSYHEEKWALRGINFDLYPGQALGIVGINGAGKSTLLKILTGTSTQTTGNYQLDGSVSSLLELGAGFHPEFSGKQNIYMNAAIQGISKTQVDQQYEEIAAFTELGSALSRPVRTYSSGMAMRLGFAASMLVDPDVLILDEVLAVGDAHFQKKCMDQFTTFRNQNKTILFVSHSVFHVREICDRVIWIHDGEMVMDGDANAVTDEYETKLLEHQRPAMASVDEAAELKMGLAKIKGFDVMKPNGGGVFTEQEPIEIGTNDDLVVRLRVQHPEAGAELYPMIAVLRNDGLLVVSTRPEQAVRASGGEDIVELRLSDLRILGGEYYFNLYLADGSGTHIVDQMLHARRFKVRSRHFEKGIYLSDYSYRVVDAASADPGTSS
ncbi:MAG: polysaccharide ABC transporter ATP-binding protein [Planctomycetota bacterium]